HRHTRLRHFGEANQLRGRKRPQLGGLLLGEPFRDRVVLRCRILQFPDQVRQDQQPQLVVTDDEHRVTSAASRSRTLLVVAQKCIHGGAKSTRNSRRGRRVNSRCPRHRTCCQSSSCASLNCDCRNCCVCGGTGA